MDRLACRAWAHRLHSRLSTALRPSASGVIRSSPVSPSTCWPQGLPPSSAMHGTGRAAARRRSKESAVRRRGVGPFGTCHSRAARRAADSVHTRQERASDCACAPSARTPAAVDTAGISVTGLRYSAVIIGGVLCGLAGTYFRSRNRPGFMPNMTAGKGFHRTGGADLREMARLAGSRRMLPLRSPRCYRHPPAGNCAAGHWRSPGSGDSGAALSDDRDPARRRYRHAPRRHAHLAFPM